MVIIKKQNNKVFYFILIGLFFISLVPRLILLSKGAFDVDTLGYVISGRRTIEDLSLQYRGRTGCTLAVLLSSFSQLFFGLFGIDEVQAVLLGTAIGASLAVVAFFLFVYKLFDNNLEIGIIASLLLSFFPSFFSVTTYGRIDHAFTIFFVSLSFFFLFKYFESKRRRDVIISAFCLGLSITARLPYVLTILPWLFSFLFSSELIKLSGKKPIISKELLNPKLWIFISISALFPIFLLYLPMFLESGILHFVNPVNIYKAKWMGLFTPWLVVSMGWEIKMLSSLGILFIMSGIYFLWKESRKNLFFLSFWALSLFFFFGNLNVVSPRYLILPSLPLIIIIAYFLYSSFVKLSNLAEIKELRFLYIILVILLIYSQLNPILHTFQFRHNHDMQKEFALYLDDIVAPNAIILAQDEKDFLEYYTNKTAIKPAITCNKTKIEEFSGEIDVWLENNVSVYIIESSFLYDPCKLLAKEITTTYNVSQVGKHLNADWHHKSIFPSLFEERIFEITKNETLTPLNYTDLLSCKYFVC